MLFLMSTVVVSRWPLSRGQTRFAGQSPVRVVVYHIFKRLSTALFCTFFIFGSVYTGYQQKEISSRLFTGSREGR